MRISAPLAIVTSAALLSLGSSPFIAAQGDTASARNNTNSAIDRLGSIKNSVSHSSDELSSLAKLLDDERRQRVRMLPFVDTAINESKTTLAAAQRDVDGRQTDLRGALSSLNTAQQSLVQRVSDIDTTIDRERIAFTNSTGYGSVANELKTRNASLQRREAELESQLRTDAAIVRLTSDVDAAERTLKQLRNDPSSQHLVAAASHDWITAKNKLTAARRSIIEKDAEFASARDQLRLAQQAMTVMTAAFEVDVLSLPSVVHAREARDEAERAVRVAGSTVTSARQSADRAQSSFDQSKADLEMLERMKKDGDAQLRKIQTSIDDVRSSLDGTAGSATSAANDLAGTLSALRSIDAELSAAQCRIAELEKELACTKRELDSAKQEAAATK